MLNGRPQRLLLNLLGLHNEEDNYAGKFAKQGPDAFFWPRCKVLIGPEKSSNSLVCESWLNLA